MVPEGIFAGLNPGGGNARRGPPVIIAGGGRLMLGGGPGWTFPEATG